jgi:hypothetical protein
MAQEAAKLVQVALQGQQGGDVALPFPLMAPHRDAKALAAAGQATGHRGLMATHGSRRKLASAAPKEVIEGFELLAINHPF